MDSNMDMDMDIDLDIDLAVDHEFPHPAESTSTAPVESAGAPVESISDPVPEKVHIIFTQYSLLHQNDIEAYVSEYYPNQFLRLQWINDDSLNIIYETPEAAAEALDAFTDYSHPANQGVTSIPQAQQRAGKPLSSKPGVEFAVRQANSNDVKVKNAAAQSAYYLHNPEQEPTRRRKDRREPHHNGRRNRSETPTYGALNYDDPDPDEYDESRRKPSTRPRGRGHGRSEDLFADGGSKGRLRNRSTSPRRSEDGTEGFPDAGGTRYRSRSPPSRPATRPSQPISSARNINLGKELFPTLSGPISNARKELFPTVAGSSLTSNAGKELSASDPSADISMQAALSPTSKELFPEKRHRRTDAFDAADGSAGFNVKGMAGNRGKELFGEKIEGRSEARMKASDMF